jgi:hypothetical protein
MEVIYQANDHFPRRPIVIAVLLCAAATGCSSPKTTTLPKPARVKSQQEAATVLVTPSMVAPWSSVMAVLKPSFTMTGDTAVAEVLPVTEQMCLFKVISAILKSSTISA